MSKKDYKYFDFFAGIGGFKLAANMTRSPKYKLLHSGYCEIDPVARQVYEIAHLNGQHIQRIKDITDIKTKRNKKGVQINGFDIMFGGFPCQSFSNVGYRRGLEDERGQLFYNILDILDYHSPKFFVLENVQKLSTIKKGELLDEMKNALETIGKGYHLHIWDLIASDYGLPQKRKRLFFCGVRKDITDKKELQEPSKVNLKKSKYPTTWHLLEKGEVDEKHYIPSKTRQTVLYKNPNWQGDVNIDNSIARPITASMSKWHRANQDNYFSNAYIKGQDPLNRPKVDLEKDPIRRITPLEGFRIQGFPDEFVKFTTELNISYSAQYRLIGNAVPVELAHRVIKHFLDSYHE
jgi:DNA (cytosine-5)-methyltransferase 1